MSKNNLAVSLALEAIAEEEVIQDIRYEAEVKADIESTIEEVQAAADTANGLDGLQAVLESYKELDVTGMALFQVVGDIAGAVHGVDGALFTPGLEDASTAEIHDYTGSDKAKAIRENIAKAVETVVEKIKQFIAWIAEKVTAVVKKLLLGTRQLRKLVGKETTSDKINSIKEKLDSASELITISRELLTAYEMQGDATYDLVVWIKKNGSAGLPPTNIKTRFEAVEKKFHELDRKYSNNSQLSKYSYVSFGESPRFNDGKAWGYDYTDISSLIKSARSVNISIHAKKWKTDDNTVDYRTPNKSVKTEKITDQLIRQIEDRVEALDNLTNPSKNNSIPHVVNALRDKIDSVGVLSDAYEACSALSSSAYNVTKLSESVQKILKDVNSACKELFEVGETRQVEDNPNAEVLKPA